MLMMIDAAWATKNPEVRFRVVKRMPGLLNSSTRRLG